MADLKKKVENLSAPTRAGMKVTATWEVPAASLKTGAKDNVRFDGQDMLWVFDAKPANKGHKKHKGDIVERDATNKDTQKTDTETIKRASFYPNKGKPKLLLAEFCLGLNNILLQSHKLVLLNLSVVLHGITHISKDFFKSVAFVSTTQTANILCQEPLRLMRS